METEEESRASGAASTAPAAADETSRHSDSRPDVSSMTVHAMGFGGSHDSPPLFPPADVDDDLECVICLGAIHTRPTVVMPCGHHRFHFWCINEWVMHHNSSCPLCKASVANLHCFPDDADPWVLPVPERTGLSVVRGGRPSRFDVLPSTAASTASARSRHPRRRGRGLFIDPVTLTSSSAAAFERRAYIYRHGLYALHVGANRYSGYYSELTPRMFREDLDLEPRARAFLRRELAVLIPAEIADMGEGNSEGQGNDVSTLGTREPARARARSRLSTRQFLLEYIMTILLTMDTQGSSGQAEELLRDYLGRRRARHLLHELRSWLRSPYLILETWDNLVQYREPGRGYRGYRGYRDDRDDRDSRYGLYDHYEPGDHYEPDDHRESFARENRRRTSSV